MSNSKFAAKDADQILGRLDRLASAIQANHQSWGMPFDTAKGLVNELDKVADTIEIATFGDKSFVQRQAEVIQKEKDEPYMATFENPMAPVQTEKDEPYMSAYKDDQSSAVIGGKDETGRKLAPGHS